MAPALKIVAAILILAAIAIAVAAYFVLLPRNHASEGALLVPIHAGAGTAVTGFPAGLFLGAAPKTTDSYSINYSSSTQYTATWKTDASTQAVCGNYKHYFSGNGWTVGNEANYPSLCSIYANTASEDVEVSAVAAASGSKITVTYVKQK